MDRSDVCLTLCIVTSIKRSGTEISQLEAEQLTEYSVLIGGKAGDGIAQAGQLIASIFSELGYYVYQYIDYPSLIRGGHNFCIIRAAEKPVFTHRTGVDLILALDQKTADLHTHNLTTQGTVIYDSPKVKAEGQALAIDEILTQYKGRSIMGNTAMVAGFCGCAGIPWNLVESVFRKKLLKETDLNLLIAREAYSRITRCINVQPVKGASPRPLLSGNEWIGLGLLAGGIDAYIAYPMTPSSGVLHFLASVADEAGIDVVHPESEIAVILMALGFAYAGKKAAVGTSGGGFCLMTEGLSLSGMAEVPIVIILSQRGGPSTGLPTYTAQSDLLFACHAGQGEFSRFIAAPATPNEAFRWAAEAVHLSWKLQIPAFILSDKTFSEGIYTPETEPEVRATVPLPAPAYPYKRYADTPDGISPILVPPCSGEVVKVNSYMHDYSGITSEDPEMTVAMVQKRLRKAEKLAAMTDQPGAVVCGGTPKAKIAILCWGSPRGVCSEVAEELGIRLVSPVVLSPFPAGEFRKAMQGVEKVVLVEDSSTGQLDKILAREGYRTDELILRYDGRPFAVEELLERVRRVAS
ncbi:2-oxoacid:acceptor oxidoreductase subunit alpha [uncultured Methanospirillum sp.]|uniref:2-oxoacid:acceptor oxidoreductase subunit alpha n=1 Tax=uncultured Methanospirillum sp. TaxID=262503 RepID=UPI0029C7C6B5|nr:2-oxoacid:acceptor oxidoreductase subunit alpha [uncultured Methanospirillum sp.]